MNVGGFLRYIVCLMKMKPYLLIIACALLANVYMTLFNSSLLYYVCYNMGLSEAQASMMFYHQQHCSHFVQPCYRKAGRKVQ